MTVHVTIAVYWRVKPCGLMIAGDSYARVAFLKIFLLSGWTHVVLLVGRVLMVCRRRIKLETCGMKYPG